MVFRPVSFANLYTSVLGLALVCASGPLIQLAADMQFDDYGPLVGSLFDVVTFGAGAAALLLLAATLTLHGLEHRRFKELHRYMAKQVEAGAGGELALERTRARMRLEVERSGGYLRWLLGRGRL